METPRGILAIQEQSLVLRRNGRRPATFVCPYFKCWMPECDGHFIWPFESLKRGEENCNVQIVITKLAVMK